MTPEFEEHVVMTQYTYKRMQAEAEVEACITKYRRSIIDAGSLKPKRVSTELFKLKQAINNLCEAAYNEGEFDGRTTEHDEMAEKIEAASEKILHAMRVTLSGDSDAT